MEPGAAFFDMDRTLLGVNSAKLWAMYLWRSGEMGTWDMARSMVWLARYKLALVDMTRVSAEAVGQLAGQEEARMRAQVHGWYEAEVRRHLLPAVVARLREHQARGEETVLLTASSPYISEQVAEELGMTDYICTRFEVRDGLFTGRLDGPLCYGAGKVELAQRWADARGISLARSSFYSDSYTDMPMLEAVGSPVAVNPDPRLARHAQRSGWPMIVVA
jgi:HAD superfamily hydrolase (TIGR01490 family)